MERISSATITGRVQNNIEVDIVPNLKEGIIDFFKWKNS